MPDHRASGTGECCRAAGLSVTFCGRTTAGTPHRTPHSFSLHFPFLGISQPLHIPVKDTDCVAHARCLQSRGLGKSRRGLETAVRCDRPGFDSRTCGLARRWSGFGRRCASCSDVVARKNDGWLLCSIRLTAGPTSVARMNSFCILFARGSLFVSLSMTGALPTIFLHTAATIKPALDVVRAAQAMADESSMLAHMATTVSSEDRQALPSHAEALCLRKTPLLLTWLTSSTFIPTMILPGLAHTVLSNRIK
jgi:hypothetical protein